jgi:hypothetical protein
MINRAKLGSLNKVWSQVGAIDHNITRKSDGMAVLAGDHMLIMFLKVRAWKLAQCVVPSAQTLGPPSSPNGTSMSFI